jgi:hypothetical protein
MKPHTYKMKNLASMRGGGGGNGNHSLQLGSKTTQTLHCLSNQENASDIQISHKNHTLPLFPIQDLPISLIMEEEKDAHSNSHVFLVILLLIMDTT